VFFLLPLASVTSFLNSLGSLYQAKILCHIVSPQPQIGYRGGLAEDYEKHEVEHGSEVVGL